MVAQLKLKTKKDKSKKEEKDKISRNGSFFHKSKHDKSDDMDPTSSATKSKKKEKSAMGVFNTLKKKAIKKHKSVLDKDKEVDI